MHDFDNELTGLGINLYECFECSIVISLHSTRMIETVHCPVCKKETKFGKLIKRI